MAIEMIKYINNNKPNTEMIGISIFEKTLCKFFGDEMK